MDPSDSGVPADSRKLGALATLSMDDARGRIRAALQNVQTGLTATEASDVAIHLTDWLPEVQSLLACLVRSKQTKPEQILSAIVDFLGHAPDHLAAAKKVLTGYGVRDVFGVNAVENIDGSSGINRTSPLRGNGLIRFSPPRRRVPKKTARSR